MLFVVVEGADAVGKATLVKGLAEHLASPSTDGITVRKGGTVRTFSFPQYDTPVGKILKQYLNEELHFVSGISLAEPDMFKKADAEAPYIFQSLMLADKYNAAFQIQNHLFDGDIVICDRWWQSGYVYGVCDGLPADWLWNTQQYLPLADVNLLLDLPPAEAAKRRPQYRDRYERDREKQERVRQGYLHLWSKDGQAALLEGSELASATDAWAVLDAQQSAAEVLGQALEIIDKKLHNS